MNFYEKKSDSTESLFFNFDIDSLFLNDRSSNADSKTFAMEKRLI